MDDELKKNDLELLQEYFILNGIMPERAVSQMIFLVIWVTRENGKELSDLIDIVKVYWETWETINKSEE